MKRVLIITSEMIPFTDNWGSCQRVFYLAESLKKNNYETIVMSRKKIIAENYYGQKVHFEQIFINDVSYKATYKNEKHYRNNFIYKSKRFLANIAYLLEYLFLNEPVKSAGIETLLWRKNYKKKLKDILTNRKIDVLIISAPPFTLFLHIYLIKRLSPKTKVIFDYRDPWNIWNNRKGVSFYLEKILLNKCDLFVTTTDTLKHEIKNKFNINNGYEIFNGYDENIWENVERISEILYDKIIISYIGSIHFYKNSFRDTTEFFKAYDLLDLEDKNKLQIKFIGAAETEEMLILKSLYPEIIFATKVPTQEAIKLMNESDYLLNIHTTSDNSSKYLMGAKIYDYLRSGKRIISINNKDSYEQTFLRQFNNFYYCKNDCISILSVFKNILEIGKPKAELNRFNELYITQYSRAHQNKKYIKLIEGI